MKKYYSSIIWAVTASFLTYSLMYGFRKPISATIFEGMEVFGISYKVVVIITQVFGYLT